jgi:hypothetical protein
MTVVLVVLVTAAGQTWLLGLLVMALALGGCAISLLAHHIERYDRRTAWTANAVAVAISAVTFGATAATGMMSAGTVNADPRTVFAVTWLVSTAVTAGTMLVLGTNRYWER